MGMGVSIKMPFLIGVKDYMASLLVLRREHEQRQGVSHQLCMISWLNRLFLSRCILQNICVFIYCLKI